MRDPNVWASDSHKDEVPGSQLCPSPPVLSHSLSLMSHSLYSCTFQINKNTLFFLMRLFWWVHVWLCEVSVFLSVSVLHLKVKSDNSHRGVIKAKQEMTQTLTSHSIHFTVAVSLACSLFHKHTMDLQQVLGQCLWWTSCIGVQKYLHTHTHTHKA